MWLLLSSTLLGQGRACGKAWLDCGNKSNPFKTLFSKKQRRGNTRTTQQPPLLLEEVKHIAPTEILGTSGTGKAMEPWHEGWFLYSLPADGGNNVEYTHHDRKQKMQFALWRLASGIKMTILLPTPPATKLKPAIPFESGHLGPTTFFACNHNGVGPTTRSPQTHACGSNQTLCLMPSALHADSCSAHKHHGYPSQATLPALE